MIHSIFCRLKDDKECLEGRGSDFANLLDSCFLDISNKTKANLLAHADCGELRCGNCHFIRTYGQSFKIIAVRCCECLHLFRKTFDLTFDIRQNEIYAGHSPLPHSNIGLALRNVCVFFQHPTLLQYKFTKIFLYMCLNKKWLCNLGGFPCIVCDGLTPGSQTLCI